MSLGILTSKLQALKSIKDHDYIRRLHTLPQLFNGTIDSDFTHVTTRKSRAQFIRLSAAVCGIELCYAAETAFVSPILLKLGVPVALMTLVWCVSPLVGFFLVPLMGSLSDRCTLKLGRRRPFILLLSVGIVGGLILVPNGEYLGILMGDTGIVPLLGNNHGNVTATDIQKINATSNLVTLSNGTTLVLRSSFSPEWPSLVKLPHNHVAGIILTIMGVAMLDFNCDACQSPCRTYLLDICVPGDHPRGLSSFTVMAGLGGSVGYLMGGVNWEATSFGAALGGHVRVVFTAVLILFIISLVLTVTSFKEIPLKDLGVTKEMLQKTVRKVKKAKYKKFVNESSEEDEVNNEGSNMPATDGTYGALSETDVPKFLFTEENEHTKTSKDSWWADGNHIESHTLSDITCADTHKQNGYEGENSAPDIANGKLDTNAHHGTLFEEISLKTYLRSIVKMPRSLFVLCITNLFCWMSLVCYSLYFTDFVGQCVYGGDPRAPIGSEEHDRYDDGIRLGSFGMSLYSLSCALYSMAVEHLVEKFRAKPVYICGQLVYMVGMAVMAVSRQPAAVLLLSPCAGIMYATLFTMPYLLVAHYHSSGTFTPTNINTSCDKNIRGLGTDVALVSSMVFLAQFLLSLFMGSLVHLAGSTVTVVVVASGLSLCGAISATQVMYLDL